MGPPSHRPIFVYFGHMAFKINDNFRLTIDWTSGSSHSRRESLVPLLAPEDAIGADCSAKLAWNSMNLLDLYCVHCLVITTCPFYLLLEFCFPGKRASTRTTCWWPATRSGISSSSGRPSSGKESSQPSTRPRGPRRSPYRRPTSPSQGRCNTWSCFTYTYSDQFANPLGFFIKTLLERDFVLEIAWPKKVVESGGKIRAKMKTKFGQKTRLKNSILLNQVNQLLQGLRIKYIT